MRICLIGYGKMGHAIEEQCLLRSHEISGRVRSDNAGELDRLLSDSDVAIEFTKPELAIPHLQACLKRQVPVVCGTTGWLDRWSEIESSFRSGNGSLVYASNFSVGVQLFFALNRKLAKLLSSHPEYECSISEIHHTQKKDAPSGTSITLAEDIIRNHSHYQHWNNSNVREDGILSIHSERRDPVVGTHTVRYQSAIDQIDIEHKAFSRTGFALGAVLAAEFLAGKNGIFSMEDVLQIH